ncbi:MAG TPA: hypothetical protein VFB38_07475 [Chthonomonadaceae bacterium]|nr:hypothetical protein [Chthonomonadaceae bacterium]
MTELAPQTASLQEACVLALHSIVARLDRERDYQPYFKVDLGPPARAIHDSWDYCDMSGRYVDAFLLIRQLTGLSAEEEEAGLRRFLLRLQNPADGLFYNQAGENSEYVADMFCQSRVLIGLCSWLMETGDAQVEEALRHLVHGLMRIAERREDYVLYPRNLYREGQWLEGGLFYAPKDLWTVKPGYGGTQLEGLMQYFRLTGDEAVLPFVRRYLRYFLDAARVVDAEGRFSGHLHSQGIVPTMVGAAMLAEATGDKERLARCERFLRFTLAHCSAFGWVPDGIGWPTCETCAIGDVIHLAVRLSRLGQGDFWYEVERIARNQLLENQFRDPDLALRGRSPEPGLERIVKGSFASWARPNDLLSGPDLEGCCTGGGVRAIFHVLNNCVGLEPDGAIAVRMLFGVDTEEALVWSALPYAGRVQVRLKRAGRLKLRCPEGMDAAEVGLKVDGQAVPAQAEGSYFVLEGLQAGAEVEMTFPTPIVTRKETVADVPYTVTWKGNAVIDLSPEGEDYPTYRRQAWRQSVAPLAVWPYPVQSRRIHW